MDVGGQVTSFPLSHFYNVVKSKNNATDFLLQSTSRSIGKKLTEKISLLNPDINPGDIKGKFSKKEKRSILSFSHQNTGPLLRKADWF